MNTAFGRLPDSARHPDRTVSVGGGGGERRRRRSAEVPSEQRIRSQTCHAAVNRGTESGGGMSQLASAADATPTSRTRSVSKRAVLGVACAALVLFVALAALMALVADLGAPADPTRGELEKHRRHRTSHTPRHSSVFPEVPPPDPWLIWKSNNQTVWKPPTTCKPCMENRCHPHLEDKCSAQRGFLDPWFLELDQCMCSCCNTQVGGTCVLCTGARTPRLPSWVRPSSVRAPAHAPRSCMLGRAPCPPRSAKCPTAIRHATAVLGFGRSWRS